MTDTSATPTPPPVPPDIQAALDKIAAAAAATAAATEAAQQAEATRIDTMDTAKQVCQAACGPITDALEATTDPTEVAALIELQATTHAAHATTVEDAYLAFAQQPAGASNPAGPGTTQVTATSAAAGTAAA
jgi:hypothetical protein